MELKLYNEPPEGWTLLEAVVATKCLDETGIVRIWHGSTEGLNSWEAIGLLITTSDILREGVWHGEDDE